MPKILANVKDDILRIAREMLAQEGYEALNVRGIAARCGIGMGTIYNYYGSKEEIVAEIVINDWNVILRRMDLAVKSSDPVLARLENIFSLVREFVVGFHGTWMQMTLSPGKSDQESIRCRRHDYRSQLTDRVQTVLGGHPDVRFCADLITRVFLSYAPEPGFRFAQLAPSLAGILKACAGVTP